MENNTEFKVGDGVNFTGWTDTSAGTVIKVTPNRITVRRDSLVLSEARGQKIRAAGGISAGEYRFDEGDEGVSFEPSQGEVLFTKRQDGTFREQGGKALLCKGRSYYRDPCF